MEFSSEEILTKYVRLREQEVDPYVPDFDFTNDEIRYVRFNDAWRGTNPYSKFLLPRLTNKKNHFPKKSSQKLAKNANPENYVRLVYDSDGKLKMVRYNEYNDSELAVAYVSDRLSIEYIWRQMPGLAPSYNPVIFEWCEYDDRGRLVGVEEYQFNGAATDDVKINCEYYEYDGDVLSEAWCFSDFNKYPMTVSLDLISRTMPDRIFNPNRYKYTFTRSADGLDYVCEHYFRKSHTITHEGHISEEKLSHMAENGFCLV